MKNLIQGIVFLSCMCACFIIISCQDKEFPPIVQPDGEINEVTFENVVKQLNTQWGASYIDIMNNPIKGYDQLYTGPDMLQFSFEKSAKYSVSYMFNSGKLSASALMFPYSKEMDIQSLIPNLSFIGELDNLEVFSQVSRNTMVTSNTSFVDDGDLICIGFAPIASKSYEPIAPINLIVQNVEELNGYSIKVEGKIDGVEKEATIGCMYGLDNTFPDTTTMKLTCTSINDFSFDLTGLRPGCTYYYRTYAIVDDICYYGTIGSYDAHGCSTTYEINGQTFEMVRVEGDGDIGTFYIMQTEMPLDRDFIFGGINFSKPDKNGDYFLIKQEWKDFVTELRNVTGIPFRMPTSKEWKYAAKGGLKSKGYVYSGGNSIDDVCWYKENSNSKVQELALKTPNELGLYDMSGNYDETCNDEADIYYVDGPMYGGCATDKQESCKVTSYKPGSQSGKFPGTYIKEKNAFKCVSTAIRMVYSE